MKEELKEMFDDGVDGVHFLPIERGGIDVKGFIYDRKSKYEKQELGQMYHILIYKCDNRGRIVSKVDHFEAILTDPYVYVYNLINCDFFGVVTKKTKQSHRFIKKILKQFKEYEKN